GARCGDGARGREIRGDVEIDELMRRLGEGRLELPPQAYVQRQRGLNAPVVVDVGVIGGGAKADAAVARCDRARGRNTEEEIREGVPRQRAGERQRAARILLRAQIDGVRADVPADGDVVETA